MQAALAQRTGHDLQDIHVEPWEVERCAEGYEGTMCAACSVGYTRVGVFECRECRQ